MFYIKCVAHREYRNMTSTDRRWQLRYCENTRKTGKWLWYWKYTGGKANCILWK